MGLAFNVVLVCRIYTSALKHRLVHRSWFQLEDGVSLTLPAFLSTPGWRIFCCRSSGPGRRFLDLKTGNMLGLLYDKNAKTVERTDLPRTVILLLANADDLSFYDLLHWMFVLLASLWVVKRVCAPVFS